MFARWQQSSTKSGLDSSAIFLLQHGHSVKYTDEQTQTRSQMPLTTLPTPRQPTASVITATDKQPCLRCEHLQKSQSQEMLAIVPI